MSPLRKSVRQTLTIARRDFIATVFTPIFLLFLFAPVIMGALSGIAGVGAASAANGGAEKTRIVAIVPDALTRPIAEVDTQLRGAFPHDAEPPGLTTVRPGRDLSAQARALLGQDAYDVDAVLYGPIASPQIMYGPVSGRSADYLALLAKATVAAVHFGGALPRVEPTRIAVKRIRSSIGGRHGSAFAAVFGIFFLTLFLSGQVVGTMAEERNNKVIEVLAAAVPLESVFFGKLIGMFGVAVLFVAFWGIVVSQVSRLLPPDAAAAIADLSPAIGAPMFALLFGAYFAMAYLLLGSVFLGVGAQASTPREIQMLSLPITVLQIGMFALSSAAASHPGSWIATAAEVFPLSSPFAMAAHAANSPALWPHAAALAWQALWVAIFVGIGARLFRRGVLQSGGVRRPCATPIDNGVS